MLYFIGLGLGDAKDITVKGLEIVKKAKKVFLEHYTSILSCGQVELEDFYGRNDLILADRDLVESGMYFISSLHDLTQIDLFKRILETFQLCKFELLDFPSVQI